VQVLVALDLGLELLGLGQVAAVDGVARHLLRLGGELLRLGGVGGLGGLGLAQQVSGVAGVGAGRLGARDHRLGIVDGLGGGGAGLGSGRGGLVVLGLVVGTTGEGAGD